MLNDRQTKHLSVGAGKTSTAGTKRKPGETWREGWEMGLQDPMKQKKGASLSRYLPKQRPE